VNEFSLRKGDLIKTPDGFALLFKSTKKYWHYFYRGHSARVRKEKLWKAIDLSSDLSIQYGTNMKYRRRQKKSRHLDLHGVKHEEASDRLREYLNFVELPTTVITGNSTQMRRIVENVVLEYGLSCRESIHSSTELIIEENDLPKEE